MRAESHQTTLSDAISTRVGHCQKDNCTVYIGRGDGGDAHMLNTEIGKRGWVGNSFPVDEHGREGCIEQFCTEFEARLANDDAFRTAVRSLHGEILGCWCQRVADTGPRCHGEVVAEWADRLGSEGQQ